MAILLNIDSKTLSMASRESTEKKDYKVPSASLEDWLKEPRNSGPWNGLDGPDRTPGSFPQNQTTNGATGDPKSQAPERELIIDDDDTNPG